MPKGYHAIALEQQADYDARLKQCATITSDYSFVNLWSWAEEYELTWAWEEDLVWIRQQKPEVRHWAPIGPWDRIDWQLALSRFAPETDTFVRIPEKLMHMWHQQMADHLSFEETRGQWDYLYAVDALVELQGNRYHKKKNLLNQFKKKYDFRYQPFEAALIHKAVNMQQDWCTWRDCEAVAALAAENKAIAKVFDNWDRLTGLTGGALLVGEQMIAYAIAETLPDSTLLIHFEKGNPEYKGVYQAINQMFLVQAKLTASVVNREQDLGDDGLRRAKLSYHPIDFLKKYRVVLK
jgi:hypothetical protein